MDAAGRTPAGRAGARARVAGYASLFGLPDLYRDVVAKGAFRRSLAARGGAAGVRMLWQHDPHEPIGVWERIVEDARGLYVEGRLVEGILRAEEARLLLAAGAVDGLSIGYNTVRAEQDPDTGGRRLVELDLWEVSLVTFPACPGARVSGGGGTAEERGLVASLARAAETLATRGRP